MKKSILNFFIFTLSLHALSFNDYTLYSANQSYKSANYKKALELYFQIEPKNDIIYYNIANTLYKLKEYQKAIEYYKLIKSPSLNAKRLYNIGNAYTKEKNYLKAIIFYRNALKFKDSPKYRQNLEYAKRHMIALRDIMLSNAKCSATLAELDNFDDQNISKDLQDAKYKNEQKFNISTDLTQRVEDFIEKENNSSKKRSTKVIKNQKLELQRSETKLKEQKSKVLLIPVE